MKVIAVALATVGFATCGVDDQVSLVAVTEVEPGVLEFATSCADNISVEAEETSHEVRITNVVGSAIDGDCGGTVTVDLEAPLDERDVVVNGERWIASCPLGSIGPRDLDEHCTR